MPWLPILWSAQVQSEWLVGHSTLVETAGSQTTVLRSAFAQSERPTEEFGTMSLLAGNPRLVFDLLVLSMSSGEAQEPRWHSIANRGAC
jgi:hypothetical protein